MIVRVPFATIVLLILCICVTANGRVETVRFQSKIVGASLPYKAILPADYNTATTTRYPVLYLLHGLTGHYSDWVSRSNVADYARQYRIIVVTPEGNDSWYIDKYESYILEELIPDVQQRYRTIEARYGRAIAGLSMGGYGAIKFGLKSPQTFAFAGSMSGAFGVTRFTEKDVPQLWHASLKLFGPLDSETRKTNDLFEIVNGLPPARINSLPFFYFDCGTEDAPYIFTSNRDLAKLMFDKKIPHEFRELPGDHSWAYWDQQIPHVLEIASQKMRMPGRIKMGARAAGA
ncbi:MAG TPA: alpha/beta hydrolase family protein [Pyrinomonadaceae bacterium]|jgi:S-formylglutathione hydrolase FrmB|nr:alpha/beta hydrolase family protein [Pyrinomonadaceae bacterium]